MKKYKGIFFDWDGTAVLSRKASPDRVLSLMKPLLEKGVQLAVISGTTYENIAGGHLHESFTPDELKNLYLGLGRGAYNYRFDTQGNPYVWKDSIPEKTDLLAIHDICYEVHRHLLLNYGFPTDIVFSRPNYCKIDLMVTNSRGDQLYLQENEIDLLNHSLQSHGFTGGLMGLTALAEKTARKKGLFLSATTDAKYLEIGISSKSDNVDTIMEHLTQTCEIQPSECSFWGDEYIGLDDGLFGNDSYMMTALTKPGDFFDVSEVTGVRPEGVKVFGGGVSRFLDFLEELLFLYKKPL